MSTGAYILELMGGARNLVQYASLAPGQEVVLAVGTQVRPVVLPRLKRSAHGCVVNVGGNAGRQPLVYHLPGVAAMPGFSTSPSPWPSTSAAKGSGSWGWRWAGRHAPASEAVRSSGPTSGRPRARIMEQIPLRAISRPESVANLVCFLASDRVRMITATTITIDGGFTRGV